MKSAKKSSFEAWLRNFSLDKSFADWPQTAQWPIVRHPEFYTAKSVEPLLRSVFVPLEKADVGWIPVEKIAQLDTFSTRISEPAKAFNFYGFRKIKTEYGWLLGIFAYKTTGMANNEYGAHPFLMVTYSPEGKIIDSYVWWLIEDDVLQVWTSIDVHGDTLLTGHKKEMEDQELSETYTKVEVRPDGRFDMVFEQYPEPSKF